MNIRTKLYNWKCVYGDCVHFGSMSTREHRRFHGSQACICLQLLPMASVEDGLSIVLSRHWLSANAWPRLICFLSHVNKSLNRIVKFIITGSYFIIGFRNSWQIVGKYLADARRIANQ